MKPIDFRNETWEQLKGRLGELRERAYWAWQAYGPGTTRQVAEAGGMDILTFRPRTTELVQLGAVDLVENQPAGNEGVYRARSPQEWQQWYEQNRQREISGQMQLL